MQTKKGGKFSRNKGRREEQQLVLYLANLGYKAERILRQYFASGEADVKATKDGVTYTFENKSRNKSFKSIYDAYFSERDVDGVFRFVQTSGSTAVAVSTHFTALLGPDQAFRNMEASPGTRLIKMACNRMVKLKELKQSADFLVIKDNGKPRLFLRYWG